MGARRGWHLFVRVRLRRSLRIRLILLRGISAWRRRCCSALRSPGRSRQAAHRALLWRPRQRLQRARAEAATCRGETERPHYGWHHVRQAVQDRREGPPTCPVRSRLCSPSRRVPSLPPQVYVRPKQSLAPTGSNRRGEARLDALAGLTSIMSRSQLLSVADCTKAKIALWSLLRAPGRRLSPCSRSCSP